MQIKGLYNSVLDNLYGSMMFANAITHPKAWLGRPKAEGAEGDLQNILFNELRDYGFKRTPFQIVFPKQTVGIIYPIKDDPRGVTEAHVRFYSTGEVHCELEVGRYDPQHYSGPRYDGKEFLENILEESELVIPTQQKILDLVVDKDYSYLCARIDENPLYQNLKSRAVGTFAFMLYRHGLGTVGLLGGLTACATPSEANPAIFGFFGCIALMQATGEFLGLNIAGHQVDLYHEVRKINQSSD